MRLRSAESDRRSVSHYTSHLRLAILLLSALFCAGDILHLRHIIIRKVRFTLQRGLLILFCLLIIFVHWVLSFSVNFAARVFLRQSWKFLRLSATFNRESWLSLWLSFRLLRDVALGHTVRISTKVVVLRNPVDSQGRPYRGSFFLMLLIEPFLRWSQVFLLSNLEHALTDLLRIMLSNRGFAIRHSLSCYVLHQLVHGKAGLLVRSKWNWLRTIGVGAFVVLAKLLFLGLI